MDQPHGAHAALPNILEGQPDHRLLHGKVSSIPIYLPLIYNNILVVGDYYFENIKVVIKVFIIFNTKRVIYLAKSIEFIKFLK